MSDEPRHSIERAKKNEALFRQVNERIRRLSQQLEGDDVTEYTCECADGTCTDNIPIALPEYERVRQDRQKFIVARGHVFPDVEEVVEKRADYWVVRKYEDVEPAA